jgi:hypothetical protein
MTKKYEDVWDAVLQTLWTDELFPQVIRRIGIFGYSRSGKTTETHGLTGSEKVTLYENLPLDDIIGGYKFIDGNTVWVDGPAARALRHGRILQIDEMHHRPMECETMLYALMDIPSRITLPTGELLTEQPGYGVVWTMNPTPDTLPHPIFDRTQIFLKANVLSKAIRKELGPKLAEVAQNVLSHNQPNIDGWHRPLTVTGLVAYVQLIKAGLKNDDAGRLLGFTGHILTDLLAVTAERKSS